MSTKSANFFKLMFYGALGQASATLTIVVFSLIFIIPGVLLIKNYNKKNSKPLNEIQIGQYMGIVLCVIGVLPWLQYMFSGFGLEAGSSIFDDLVE